MIVLHVNWSQGGLYVWAEDVARIEAGSDGASDETGARPTNGAGPAPHPHALSTSDLERAVTRLAPDTGLHTDSIALRLPARSGAPLPSPGAAHAAAVIVDFDGDSPELARFETPALRIAPESALAFLDKTQSAPIGSNGGRVALGPGARYFAAAGDFVRYVLCQHRYVPSLTQDETGQVRGVWQPWLADDAMAARASSLLAAMPPVARAQVDVFAHQPWAILEDFLLRVTDAACRDVLRGEDMADAIASRDASEDPHVMWLTGLLDAAPSIDRAGLATKQSLVRGVTGWIGSLDDRGADSPWRLCLRLDEPIDLAGLEDLAPPGEGVRWTLRFQLQSLNTPGLTVDASEIWLLPHGSAAVGEERLDDPHELLLKELARASRLYRPLERALNDAEPTELQLTTRDAYAFLREHRPLLIEQGFGVHAPEWWDSPTVRLGAKLTVDAPEFDPETQATPWSVSQDNSTRVGLGSLVSYQWRLAVGDTTLTVEQFEKLAQQHAPLVRIGGQWVEIRPEDVKSAMDFLRDNPGGKIDVGKALRLAYASDQRETGLPVIGLEASGWVSALFNAAAEKTQLPMLPTPEGFVGVLRPYQLKGLSWLAFLDKLGLGACLADDMGLGKTIQLLALMLHEREEAERNNAPKDPPTLLVAPMSVIGNWIHEARRFSPSLRVMIHHGLDRLTGEAFLEKALSSDMVITTYALTHRDVETLEKVPWRRVVLDEAQNIKNPAAKQTAAVRRLDAPRRVALTGTPVENRLGELWSVMDFLNPGFLGSAAEFRRRFAIPIERYRDARRGAQLRGLIRPFVLRRLKTDPKVIADLPQKVESREYCYLTPEQATLYETCVRDMLQAAEKSEGMRRRGVVLSGLIKLKQICNHPAQFFREHEGSHDRKPPAPARSGKLQRLVEMMSEIVDAGDCALVFTQFRQMGHILASVLGSELDCNVLFMHGGTPQQQRQQLIERFQKADGTTPIFVLSLKAGGFGLNLTAANHVFHFDRWWNPAVESQATDRAYRIGQTRTVHVHKFVVSGTLEERIDEMIEQKTELAEQIVGSGEQWLTELSTDDLRELLSLRREAVGDELEDGA